MTELYELAIQTEEAIAGTSNDARVLPTDSAHGAD